MKGGSIASNSVIGSVDQKAFDKLNSMFDNKVGGKRRPKTSKKSSSKPKPGGCGCSTSRTRQGGASMLGSTMEAFQNNVRTLPGEMFVGNSAAVMSSITTPNSAKKSNSSTGVKLPNSAAKLINSSAPKMANSAPKMANSAPKMANSAPKMANSAPKMANSSPSSASTGGYKKKKVVKKAVDPKKKKSLKKLTK